MKMQWHARFTFFLFGLFFSHLHAQEEHSLPVLLIINYNHAHYESILLLRKIYQPYFGNHIVFYGPEPHQDVNLCRHTQGYLSYVAIADAMLKYPNYEGYFFLMDDCIINAWKFNDLDRTKIWFGQMLFMDDGQDKGNAIAIHLKENATYWYWWNTPWGWQTMTKAFNQLPQNYKSALAQNWGEGNIVAAFSDLAYIPKSYAQGFITLATLFGKEQVFLEMALPTLLYSLADKQDIIFLPGTGSYVKPVSETYDTNVFFNHPVKLSTQENQQFIGHLFGQLA